MLKKLFSPAAPAAKAPAGERLYAIGDIHGCSDLLDRLTASIGAEETGVAVQTRLVFLGDYLDRGPDSRGVMDRLIALRETRPNTVFLKGNHEAVFLDFLDAPDETEDWLHWGGAETLESYGVVRPWSRPVAELGHEMRERLPESHLSFLRELATFYEAGDYFFVHAGVKPGVPLDKQDERDLLWIRGEFHNAAAGARPSKVVVHGHQPIKAPLDNGWRIDVDTGACFSGKLTAVVLEGETRRFLST